MSGTRFLAACAAATAGAALAGSAHGQVATHIEGAGSTLIGPVLRQIGDCFGNPVALVYQGAPAAAPPYYPAGRELYSGSALNNGAVALPAIVPFNIAGTKPFNCKTAHVNPTVQLDYANAGSGNGQLYAMTHDEPTDVGTTTEAGAPAGTVAYGGGQYGVGDYGVRADDVNAYTAGGLALSQLDAGGNVVKIPVGGNAGKFGNFIQFPIAIAPIAIAYAPVYGKTTNAAGVVTALSLSLSRRNADGTGGLRLDMATLCAIFNGKITNLNDKALTGLNGGKTLADVNDPNRGPGWTVPIQLVGQADASGATAILYRALAAQCGQGAVVYNEYGDNYNYNNAYLVAGADLLPIAMNGGALPNALFVLQTGQSRVADQLGKTILNPAAGNTVYQFQLGYLGTPYVLPGVTKNGQNTYSLNVADLIPTGGKVPLEPTPEDALKAFGAGVLAFLPPQSDAEGRFVAQPPPTSTSHGLRASPQDWAAPISTTILYSDGFRLFNPLADPNAFFSITTAYPIVGTVNLYLNTCYAAANAASMLKFLNYLLTSPTVIEEAKATPGVLTANGLSPLPAAWRNAINATFINPIVGGLHGTAQLNLNILKAGAPGLQCAAVTPGA